MVALRWTVVLLAAVACASAQLGTQTSVEEYPSLAQVESRVGLLWLQYCAASVLTSYHVLSTANCFSGDWYAERNRRIRAGSSYRGVDGVVVEVSHAYIHPDFGVLGKDADLSVVRLATALPLGDTIKQIMILGEGIYLPYGLKVQLVGWGTTAEGGLIGDNNLYELDIYTVDNDECLLRYYPDSIITENMICTRLEGATGRDFDSRDEGAPIFYSNTAVGVVSFGVASADDEYPLVSTAIGSYTSWIVETATY